MIDLDASAIKAAFTRAGLPPPVFRCFDTLGSTNDAALAWLMDDPPPGMAFVTTGHQQRGRGRMGRTWTTTPGGALTVSFLVRAGPEALTRLPLLGALSVCEALADFGIAGSIKWPNDVQVAGRKVAGVLAEASWVGADLRGAVIGIGVNVREDFSATPLADTAGSLTPLTGIAVDRADLLAALYRSLGSWIDRIAEDAFFAAWRSRLNMIGQPVRVAHGDDARGLIEGVAEAVAADGALLVRLADGQIQRLIAGDVTRLA